METFSAHPDYTIASGENLLYEMSVQQRMEQNQRHVESSAYQFREEALQRINHIL